MRDIFPAVLALVSPLFASAQTIDYRTAHLERKLPAIRAERTILIDGVLDEDAWQKAPVATNFIQRETQEGAPATYDTEVRILYDDEHLYIGVVAFDDEPENLIVTDLTRDYNTRAVDSFAVVLDTFHDRRNSYMLQTNPLGAKMDAQSFNEGQSFDLNWDGVWYVKSRIVEDGWVAEYAIPFKTVKFRGLDEQTWGINFVRRNRRLNEESNWAPIPRIFTTTRVSLAGTLEGLQNVKPGSRFKITPYARGDVSKTLGFDRTADGTGGLDAKIGIGSGLTLDLTANTDFSEVEADVQQVNLTRFSFFFPEKRDFFLENSGVFRFGPPEDPRRRRFQRSFGLTGGSLGGGQSRGNDLLLFFSRRIGLGSEGEPIPVIGGGRLTGRSGPYELGFLNIQTGEEPLISNGDNFTVARVKRNIFQNSDIGFMFINRATMDSDHFNRSIGADANLRLSPQMDVNAYIAKTASPDLEGDDLAGRVAYSYNSRSFTFSSAFSTLQDNFNPEVGFAPRIGVRRASGRFQYNYRQPWARDTLREIGPSAEIDYFTDQEGNVVSRYFNLRLSFRLQSGGFVSLGRNANLEQLSEPFEIHPDVTIEPGFFTFDENFVVVFSDPSRVVSGNARISRGGFYSGTKTSYSLGAALKLGPRFTAQAGWSINDVELAEGEFTTHLVTTRASYSFSPSMFVNALIQYNSITDELSSNVRFNVSIGPCRIFLSCTTISETIKAGWSTARSSRNSLICSTSRRTMSVKILIPTPLRRYTGQNGPVAVEGGNVGEVLDK